MEQLLKGVDSSLPHHSPASKSLHLSLRPTLFAPSRLPQSIQTTFYLSALKTCLSHRPRAGSCSHGAGTGAGASTNATRPLHLPPCSITSCRWKGTPYASSPASCTAFRGIHALSKSGSAALSPGLIHESVVTGLAKTPGFHDFQFSYQYPAASLVRCHKLH